MSLADRKTLVLLLAAVLSFSSGCSGSRAKEVTDVSFAKKVLESEMPVLVDFWATWCGPCRIMEPVVEELSREYDGRLKVFKMDVDKNPQTPGQYGVQSIPTLLLFRKGNVRRQFMGVVAKEDLKEQIEEALNRTEKPDLILQVDNESFAREVLESKVPVLVDIWAPWCGPCRILAPTIEELSWEYEGRMKVVKVNLDENKAIARKYNADRIPCVLLFKKGRPVRQWVGLRPKWEYANALDREVPAAEKPTPSEGAAAPQTPR